MSISLVAGLGNPGRDYANTRHNLGWVVLEALAQKQGLSWQNKPSFEAEIARWDYAPGRTRWLVKPLTFMNESGRSLAAVARYYKLPAAEIAAIYDDINIDVGWIKVSEKGSAGGQTVSLVCWSTSGLNLRVSVSESAQSNRALWISKTSSLENSRQIKVF